MNKKEFEELVDQLLLLPEDDLIKTISEYSIRLLIGLTVYNKIKNSELWKLCNEMATLADIDVLDTISYISESLKIKVTFKGIPVFENVPLSERENTNEQDFKDISNP